MSGSAEVDGDATMTRDAGASRTFRSIFGDASQSQDGGGNGHDELKLQRFSRTGGGNDGSDRNGYRGDANHDDDDDDDDGVWSDDAATPKERGEGDEDYEDGCEEDDNNGDERMASDAVIAALDADEQAAASAADGSNADAPRSEGLKAPHRRSMEEWADDDEEEDTWKDMLQAKVNQLELVIQSNNDSSSSSSATQQQQITPAVAAIAETRIALAAATHALSLRGSERLVSNRNKIQRTAGGVHATSSAPGVSSPSNYLRKRSGSRDSSSSSRGGSSKPAGDAKKCAKVASGSGRRDSMTRSSSTSSLSTLRTRSSQLQQQQRKNSLDATSVSTHAHARSSSRSNGAMDALGSHHSATSGGTTTRQISDAEAVRRFILQDIKQMSMDRLVADAKRLRFLEDFHAQQTTLAHTRAQTGGADGEAVVMASPAEPH